tara:strand:+ start:705 stop:1325 length:621 start_codon:yes stop_codon:yes gene_type:complete
MPLFQTDGSTARNIESAVVWRQGTVSSGTAYVDLQYSDARTAGYSFFKLVLAGVRIPSKQLAMWGLKSSGTPETAGYYGGTFSHGEGSGYNYLSQQASSNNFNNYNYFPISATREGAEDNIYLGNYTIYITDPIGSNITGIPAAYPNVWWQGTHRLTGPLASNTQGGGVNNRRSAHYGVRFGTHDGTTNMDRCNYVLTAYKEGGQY